MDFGSLPLNAPEDRRKGGGVFSLINVAVAAPGQPQTARSTRLPTVSVVVRAPLVPAVQLKSLAENRPGVGVVNRKHPPGSSCGRISRESPDQKKSEQSFWGWWTDVAVCLAV